MRLLLAVLAFATQLPAHAVNKELVVGLQPTQPIRALIARHDRLAADLRRELNRPVRLVSARNSRIFGQRLLKGDYELALVSAHLARLVQVDGVGHPLVRYEPSVPVFLLTRQTDAEGAPVAALKTKVLALPDDTMLATIAGQHWLTQQHLLVGRDYTVLVTGGYASAVHAVVNGQADMALGALGGIGQARPEDIQQLRIVKEITSIPQLVFVARHDVTAKGRAKFQRALLALHSSEGKRLHPVGNDDLAEMDIYLPETRMRLALPDPASP
ncbi:MAG: PhnD/SsuA/transferrin family substrate-binding protein [Thiobacillus sp.]|nr:PhnD/SsuA/transferrin family substrate-binding protein [Thiobacillus sp.]